MDEAEMDEAEEEISYLDLQYPLLREVVAAACPETKANGIYETDHAEMTPWEDFKLPYAVIAIDEMSESDEYGNRIQQDVFEVPVDIYYIAEVKGPMSPVRRALERIMAKFNTWDEEKIKVISVGSLSWGKRIPANEYFASKDQKVRAGRITLRILIAKPFYLP